MATASPPPRLSLRHLLVASVYVFAIAVIFFVEPLAAGITDLIEAASGGRAWALLLVAAAAMLLVLRAATPALVRLPAGLPPRLVLIPYGLFLATALAIGHSIAGMEASYIITLSGMSQCFGILLLWLQPASGRGFAGISARALLMHALSFGLRLSSSTWLQGYLPTDRTGDGFYQAVDFCALAMALLLLGCVLVGPGRHSHRAIDDSCPVFLPILGAGALGGLLRADLDGLPLFDGLWMWSLFLGATAAAPQVVLLRRTRGLDTGLVSHSLTAMAIGQVLSAVYFWHAREDMDSKPWIEGINHPVTAILTAHALSLGLVCSCPRSENDTHEQ